MIRIHIPKDDIRVGQRRLLATLVIANRTGGGPGALRADIHQPALIHPYETTAAGPDLRYVDGRNSEHVPLAFMQPARPVNASADFVLGGPSVSPTLHNGRFGCGPPQVQGNDICDVQFLRNVSCPHHPRRRTTFDNLDRHLCGLLGADHSPA